jgi:hypothetical protein
MTESDETAAVDKHAAKEMSILDEMRQLEREGLCRFQELGDDRLDLSL